MSPGPAGRRLACREGARSNASPEGTIAHAGQYWYGAW